jgi:hypothetical protein
MAQIQYILKGDFNMLNQLKNRAIIGVATIASAAVGAAQTAPIVDWAAEATTLKGEMTPAISAGIGVGFVLLAVAVGYKVFRRFVH